MTTKEFLKGFYYSFPIQLLLLHLRKYQILLFFWFILASAINGDFMSTFGADSLFLAPEYLGKVNTVSAIFVGMAIWDLHHELAYNYVYTAQQAFQIPGNYYQALPEIFYQ